MTLVPIIPLGIAPTAREPQPLNYSDAVSGAIYPSTFCGALPSELGAAARNQMRWRQRHLQWCWIDRVPGLTADKQVEDTTWALEQWSLASNRYLTFEPTNDAKGCDILLTTARIDGSGRVLADMMLPPGDDRQLRGRFDTGEQWDTSIIFRLVALHELGHAMGLDHINDRNQKSVLDSMYNPALKELQPLDKSRLLSIYPEAVNFTPPVTPQQPPGTQPPFVPGPAQPISVTINLGALGTFQGPMRRIL